MTATQVGAIEVLLTVDDKDAVRAEKDIRARGERIEKKPIKQKIDADESGAIAGMDRVEEEAKKLVSERAVLKVDADIERTEKQLARAKDRLEDLAVRAEGGIDVEADVRRAEQSISRIETQLDRLRTARSRIEVDADTSVAESALEDLSDSAEEAGDEGGRRGGAKLVTGIVAGLASIPIVGAIAKVGHTLADTIVNEFQNALQIEVRQDRLQALTGVSEEDAGRYARAAGEAYANNFGESIESNMNTARLALQFKLIDADATTRESQKVVEGLAGIADVLEEDVQPTATAVSTLLRTGLANSAQHAYDLIAAGARNGLNRNEDLLDTLTEYPVVLRRLGITGEEMMGLLNQGLEAGARNTDVLADGLKEFQIRATDGSEASARGFERLGLSAEDMTAKIAAGGATAREGLQETLDQLREMTDPVERNAAAVELFGTKAEDLGEALFALDLNTAVDSLDGVTGAAERMFNTISDNDASRISQAQRNIEVAAEGIKGALASAFADPLGDFADWVSQNRGPVLQFFSDLINGGLDFGKSVVLGTADGAEALGGFVSGPLADFVFSVADVLGKLPWPFNQDTSDLKAAAEEMRGFKDSTAEFADVLRTDVVGGIETARDQFNGFMDAQVQMGFLNDASLRLASAIDAVGYAADGTTPLVNAYTVAQDGSVQAGATLESQIRGSIAALGEQISAAEAANESQGQLTERYNAGTAALVGQLTQMGLTEEQARALIDTVLQTPESATTDFTSNAKDEQDKVQALADRIITLPDGSVIIDADTSPGQTDVEEFIRRNAGRRFTMYIDAIAQGGGGGRGALQNARGNLVEFMASGGIPGLTPMSSGATVVPANTWRVVGDRGDVPEAFIPLDGSARSWSILMEAWRRMPGAPAGTAEAAASTSGGDGITGLAVTGRLVVDASGFAQLVDARVVEVLRDAMSPFAGGRR